MFNVLGTVNIHPSLLPLYRGAAPVQRALQVQLFFQYELITLFMLLLSFLLTTLLRLLLQVCTITLGVCTRMVSRKQEYH